MCSATVTSVSTDDVPLELRFEWWGQLMKHVTMPTAMSSPYAERFHGHGHSVLTAAAEVSALSVSPMSSRRRRTHIQRHDPEDYFLFLAHGSPIHLEQGRNTVRVGAGDIGLFDTSHPLAAEFLDEGRDTRVTLMRLPRASVGLPYDRVDRLLGAPLDARSPAGALLGHYLSGVRDNAARCGPAELERLGAIGFDLALAFVAGQADTVSGLSVETRESVLLTKVRAFIERHLGDPGLRPAAIAEHHHISVRALHLLFRTQPETVAALIRRRRLERCRADLLDPRLRGRTIGEISARWGFRTLADFSRAFRAAYGLPPSELRRAPQGPAGAVCAPLRTVRPVRSLRSMPSGRALGANDMTGRGPAP
ncbi:helix-turn-helix domain-containing protein [Streptomyces sp. G45]|uniref:helix-turn-helix domain-containing protein n=1 Tax=Streptomyces sp. G45 TaxID=3406627 RepID=UPI003C225821